MSKIPGVALEGEYAHLADLVEIAYWEDRRVLVDALEDAAFSLWGCERDAYSALREWREHIRQQLWVERRRREDIIFWLYTDTQLRGQGSSYPDAYEAYPPPNSCSDDEF